MTEVHEIITRYILCDCCDVEVEFDQSFQHPEDDARVCRKCYRMLTDFSAWDDPKILHDSRIEHLDPRVRRVAEVLHRNESMHLHEWISEDVCAYCALRASRAVRTLEQ